MSTPMILMLNAGTRAHSAAAFYYGR